jgi:tetratricopeptide (TPR) repeat protein
MDHVEIWEAKVTIPTYEVGEKERNPMFFEKRVYQGSSGVVYPNPVIEKIFDTRIDKKYTGLFLENKYLKIMILPEIGGRVQLAYDKLRQRHFVYYNQVIKPALVGLTGPWISGGIEFNWPQHHRPSTFEQVDYRMEENADGSKTVWVNEIEKMFHTKGMAGFTLYPNRAYLEIKAQLYNRTSLPQTFLWWANPAVKVNDDYQSVFPSDVNAVFDHGKRDVSTFPIATGTYYKVDYSPGTDISRYSNIPVPTSYMAINSEYDFVGGYEHDSKGGLLHVANHHVSPGKKQWTWGHGDFGRAWDRNLTDEDGPYIELMTGMFTDNQPDFTWLMPNEEKSFTQYFLPYHELGVVKNATKDVLLNLETQPGFAKIQVLVTSVHLNLTIALKHKEAVLFETKIDIVPEKIFEQQVKLPSYTVADTLTLIIWDSTGKEIIRFDPSSNSTNDIPTPALAAAAPADVDNNEQLFLIGQHLEQYRHATYSPVPYYEEALRRDPKDIRNNNALGCWYLRRGQFEKSEAYFRKAVETSTGRNPNPYDGEPYYNLGLSLLFQQKLEDAYRAMYKAAWSSAWQDAAYLALAQIDLKRGDYSLALEHINFSLDRNARSSKAYVVKSSVLRALGRFGEATVVCNEALRRDGFNLGALYELAKIEQGNGTPDGDLSKLRKLARDDDHNFIEYALDYVWCGLYAEALDFLRLAEQAGTANPIVYYHMADVYRRTNNVAEMTACLHQAAAQKPDYCFPNRLEDIGALRTAIENNPSDGFASYYLGNLFYDKRQYQEAIQLWEQAVKLKPDFPTAQRNLGIAVFNKLQDPQRALAYFEKASQLNPDDARILMEVNQLYFRLNKPVAERLAFLLKHREVAEKRDDLYLEIATLYNLIGEHGNALKLIENRKFHPWEGGEGKVSGQYIFALIGLARENIANGDFQQAIDQLMAAQIFPHNLGEGKLPDAQENDISYWLGCAYEGLNATEKAKEWFLTATKGNSEPSAAIFYNDQQPDKIFYQGLAWKKLDEHEKANQIFQKLIDYGQMHRNDAVTLDYFAVSLPDLLIFDSDLNMFNRIHCLYVIALGFLGLEDYQKAEDFFRQLLALDCSHAGTRLHLEIIKNLRIV